jgi:uncharacterized HAD superfamily protein
MKSLKLGIDVDGTLADFARPLINYMRSLGIETPDYEDTHDFDLSKTWKCTPQEAVRRIDLFLDSREFRNLEPIEGVSEAFEILLPPHKGYAITARPKSIAHVTKKFLETHLGGKCSGAYHLGTCHKDGAKVSKAKQAKKLGLDLFVEDSPVEASEISACGIPVLLLNRPWNANYSLPSLVTRVNEWREIVHYVREYASD